MEAPDVELLDYAFRVGGFLLVAGAVYGGIRADLRGLHSSIEVVGRATRRMHKRLDEHIYSERKKDERGERGAKKGS